jgi:hypothetical protein
VKQLVEVLAAAGTICRELELEVALIGGLAVSLRVEPRFTRDIDIAVAVPGDEQAEAIIRGFRAAGYSLRNSYENETTDRLAAVRLVPPRGEEAGIVDFFFSYTGIEDVVVAAAEPLEVSGGYRFPIATLGHLLALKVLGGRPTDLQDARGIIGVASPEDLDAAREAVELIALRRAYPRRGPAPRNLPAELEELIAAGPGTFCG